MATVTSSDGTTIAYDKTGEGPAVILVDAASGFRGFGPMQGLAALLEPNFTVICYDRRGRGESGDTLPYAVEREVEDLQALIDVAGGSACVYGFSSGGVIGLYAAAEGAAITKLAALEPPLVTDGSPQPTSTVGAEIAALVAEGRRGDAVERFQRGIGVPAEITAGMRQSPQWATMEGVAHTLVYDLTIIESLPPARLKTVTTPTLVLASEASDDRLRGWAQGVSNTLPNGTYRALPGEWHGVSSEDLARELTAFFGS